MFVRNEAVFQRQVWIMIRKSVENASLLNVYTWDKEIGSTRDRNCGSESFGLLFEVLVFPESCGASTAISRIVFKTLENQIMNYFWH